METHLMLPDMIQKSIEQMLLKTHQNSYHDLLPKERLIFYNFVQELSDQTIATTFFKWLSFLSASQVKFVWDESMLDNNFVSEILKTVEGILLKRLDLVDTTDRRELFYNAVGGIYEETAPRPRAAMEAAYLSLQLVSNAKSFQDYNIKEIERGFSDEIIISIGDFDVETFAVLAYSGFNYDFEYREDDSDNNMSNFDSQKRLEFWKWWLTEAIPQAWELAQETYKPQ